MIKSSLLLMICFFALAIGSLAFCPLQQRTPSSSVTRRFMVPDMPVPAMEQVVMTTSPSAFRTTVSTTGLMNLDTKFLLEKSSSAADLPSMTMALSERKIPTAEEIAQKKLTFNLWFWGGGFVAPFVATIFYFGFKFWEK